MTIIFGPTFTSTCSISLAPPHCQFCQMEGFYSMMSSSGSISSWTRPLLDCRRASDPINTRYSLFGAVQTHWLPMGHDLCLSKVRVAADYSDSVPDSSNNTRNRGYHPLEELKVFNGSRETMLTSAEIARTTVEANNNALLIFPQTVHCEPHGHISWGEFQYFVDDFGDLYFEIFDDENIIQDRSAINPVNVMIGMDIPLHANRRVADEHANTPNSGNDDDDVLFYDENFEVADPEVSDTPIDWGMPKSSHLVHPMYFAKCLTKAISTKYRKRMEHPSNGISILGCLRPALMEDVSYLRRHCLSDDSDDCTACKDESEKEKEQVTASYHLLDDSNRTYGEISSFNSKYDGTYISSTLYKLEVLTIDLFSVYGVQSAINLEDFEEAEPDFLAHSASTLVERFTEKGMQCNVALKAFCRKKGHDVEGAHLIGVDSLGIDVRVFFGIEAQTLRFPFKARVLSESAAEKKIQRMLFPRCHKRKLKTQSDGLGDLDCF